jgi:hypothetical protein
VIYIEGDDVDFDSALAATEAINRLRETWTYPLRPVTSDTHWVKTLWPNENYL